MSNYYLLVLVKYYYKPTVHVCFWYRTKTPILDLNKTCKYAKVFNRCIFSVAKTAWRKLLKRKLHVPRKSTYSVKHVDETVCMNIQSMDHNYIQSWQAYNLPHFLKLIGSQKQVAKTPTTTRAQTSERDMSVVFLVFCVVCLQYNGEFSRGLFISGWNHVEIKWKYPHMTFVAQQGFKVRRMNIMLFWQKQNLIYFGNKMYPNWLTNMHHQIML